MFLDMIGINYYSKFIKNYADMVGPLYELFKKNRKWDWTKEQELAFKKAKELKETKEHTYLKVIGEEVQNVE